MKATGIRRIILAVFLVLVFSATIRCSRQEPEASATSANTSTAPQFRTGTVARVVDGDTFYLGKQRMRMALIDAPKIQTYEGRESRNWLHNKISGKQIHYSWKKRGHYGRPLVTVWLRSEDVGDWSKSLNSLMLEEGLCTLYDRRP